MAENLPILRRQSGGKLTVRAAGALLPAPKAGSERFGSLAPRRVACRMRPIRLNSLMAFAIGRYRQAQRHLAVAPVPAKITIKV